MEGRTNGAGEGGVSNLRVVPLFLREGQQVADGFLHGEEAGDVLGRRAQLLQPPLQLGCERIVHAVAEAGQAQSGRVRLAARSYHIASQHLDEMRCS